jgi:hypothetical protein
LIGPVLQFQDLQDICKPGERPRLATVEAWATKLGIRYEYDAGGGIWTTVDALNRALGLSNAAGNVDAPYRPEDI